MLGEKIINFFSSNDIYKTFATFRNEIASRNENVFWKKIDLNDKYNFNLFLSHINPDIIIHCAANTNLDQCEIDNLDAVYLHSEIIEDIKLASPNSIFVYVSTDSIFNGKSGNYKENDIADPINKYAFSKLEGEKNVVKHFKDYIIIRTNIYGYHSSNNKPSLAQWAITKLKNNETINGFEDVFFNPVYTSQLAMVIQHLLKIDFRGLINVGCNETVSKYEFLLKIAKKFKFNENLIAKSSSNNHSFIAARPMNTSLNNEFIKTKLENKISLDDGIEMLFNDLIIQNL